MTIEVIEASLTDLVVPPSVARYSDSYVYEHLKRYCSKFRPLPAIVVTSDGAHLVLTSRYQYVAIARELGEDRIRAALQGVTFSDLRQQGVPGVLGLVSQEELDREIQDEIIPGWHVLFFKTVPEHEIVTQIEARFRAFLKQSLPEVPAGGDHAEIWANFDATGPCFEIRFPTPVTDHAWAQAYLSFLTSISRDLAPISTYQGAWFGS
jgi:hypothetical protein